MSLISKRSSSVAFFKFSKLLYFFVKSFAVFIPTFFIPSAYMKFSKFTFLLFSIEFNKFVAFFSLNFSKVKSSSNFKS